jgi:hypothetical protein
MLEHPTTLHREHLGRDEVHLWRVDLDDPAMSLARCDALLGVDERDRAHFVVRRAALRWILACYAGVDAAALRFSTSARGRPQLVADEDARDLRFSVARSERSTSRGWPWKGGVDARAQHWMHDRAVA